MNAGASHLFIRPILLRQEASQPSLFRRSYGIARDYQMEDLMDEILEIADDDSGDHVKKTGAAGKASWVFNREHLEDCRRRIRPVGGYWPTWRLSMPPLVSQVP